MKSNTENALILNLKGQVSRILSTKATILRDEEKCGLEGVCNAVDSFILSDKDEADLHSLKDELSMSLISLRDTRKDAIRNRILPAVEKVLKEIK